MKILVGTLQIYLFGILVLIVPTFGQSTNGEGIPTGKVQFRVLMPNDILIPFLSVAIEGEDFRKEISLKVDEIDDTANLVELPVGVYKVSGSNTNYYPFRRAPFSVEAGMVKMINVFPLIRVQRQILMADGSDKYEFAPEPKYDSFPMSNNSDARLSMLIRYDTKTKRKGFFEYSSNLSEFHGSSEPVSRGVMVSFDALTIYADKVRFDRGNSTLEAQGNVVVEDGERRLKISNVKINLKDDVRQIIHNLRAQE